MMQFFVGTSGYAYKEWKGHFYPNDIVPASMLKCYAETFNSVEINNTFYRMPQESVVAQWGGQVSSGFCFVLKTARRITHLKRLKDVSSELDYFLRTASVSQLAFVPAPSSARRPALTPWGLWITIDLSSIALAGGAFSLCAAVYLIGLKRYQPIARTATWVGLIGYSMAMLCLFMDIGRPFKFYQAMIYWNTHSLLWEVTMCIILYFTVLALESLPIIANLEWLKNKFPKLTAKMSHVHHFAPYLAIAGLVLSSMHQASLGGAYGVLKARPFWYKPGLPVMFTLTAIIGGIAMTLFVSMLAARLTDKARVNDGLLDVAPSASVLCAVTLVMPSS